MRENRPVMKLGSRNYTRTSVLFQCVALCCVWSGLRAQVLPADEAATEAVPTAPSEPAKSTPSNPLERAIELNANGVYAEAATAFDHIYESSSDLSVLLRAGIAWYQGGFLAAAEARFSLWLKRATELGEAAPEGIAQRRSAVESLQKKASSKVFTVPIEVPRDVYRPRTSQTRLVVTKMSDGFAPAPTSWTLTSEQIQNPKRLRLDAGRWLFEFEGDLFQKQAEIIEVYDDSPLMLSPIPSNQMLPKETPSDERLAYREALDLFRSGDFSGAVATMEQMVPNGLSVNEAIWLFAQASERSGAWKNAEDAYRQLLKLFPKTLDAQVITEKLEGLREKANSSRAKISIVSLPKGAVITLFKGSNEIQFGEELSIYPGKYRVKLKWSSGIEDEQQIVVKPKVNQSFTCESVKANDALLALRWSVRGHFQAGVSLMSGNQSDLVTVSAGPAMITGVDVGWMYTDQLKLKMGLAYAQNRPNFEVESSAERAGSFGHWTFHHLRIPVGATWALPSKTEMGLSSGLDVLIYAKEEGPEPQNITSITSALVPILQLTVSHPASILGKGFFAELTYQSHLSSITETDSALRLQQVGLGVSKRVF